MARKTISIKGEVVDFDLLAIKRKIGDKPVSADVKNREDFVYSKRKRGSKRAVQQMIQQQPDAPQSKPEAKTKAVEKKAAAEPRKRKIIKKTTGE